MCRNVFLVCIFFAVVFGDLSQLRSAEKPTKAEISSMGKAATAYVELANHGSGTAFCIHPSGLFITNAHVVRGGVKREIILVLEPGLKNQRVLKARVVRVDEANDLALLRTEESGEFPSLALGSVDGISELMDVIAFGFPLGRALSPDKNEFPAISINSGRVTALRHKGRELQRVQIDVTLTFGNSGGPILNEEGKVVGVVVSGIQGAKGINQAIPVSHLHAFLKAPDFQFNPPELTQANLEQSHEFKVKLVSIIPMVKPIDVDLVVKVEGEPEKRLRMEFQDGCYRITAAVMRPGRTDVLGLSAEFEKGKVSGMVADRQIQIGTQEMKLSECRQIRWNPKPTVVLQNGKTVEGHADGLSKVSVQIGRQDVTLDLGVAKNIEIELPDPIAAVAITFIAIHDDITIGSLDTRVAVKGPAIDASTNPFPVEIEPAKTVIGAVTRMLPDTASDVRVGGGGRFLVLHIPKLKKLAVFDVVEAKIAYYVPLSEDKIVYGAGMEKIVVGVTEKGILERWNLLSGEKEFSRAIPNAANVDCIVMGSASSGPFSVNGLFFDLQTLKQVPVNTPHGVPGWWHPVSADGTVFGGWKPHESPSECSAMILSGSELLRFNSGGMGHIVPGPDGRILFTASGIFTNRFQRIPGSPPTNSYCLPATEGDYFLTITSAEGNSGGSISIYVLGNDQPLVKNTGITHGVHFDSWDRDRFGPWKRIHFIPRAELIIVFPPSNDRLELHRLDLDAAMADSNLDYLLVTSQPPRTARAGEQFEYSVIVKAKNEPVTVTVSSGPHGMEVSPAAVVRWDVPLQSKNTEEEIILSIKDQTDREIFHTFKLRIVK